MTPFTSGRTTLMCGGSRPSIFFASSPTASTWFVFVFIGRNGRLVHHNAFPLYINKRIGRAKINADIFENIVEECHYETVNFFMACATLMVSVFSFAPLLELYILPKLGARDNAPRNADQVCFRKFFPRGTIPVVIEYFNPCVL